MNSLILKFICVVVIIFLAGSEAAFVSYPRNELALTNERVEFQCSSDSRKRLKWTVTYAQTTELIVLFTSGNFTASGKSRYRVDTRNPGQCNLIIDFVDLSYSGKYTCTEQTFGPEIEAELAVIDPQPSCQTNASNTDNAIVENDYLWMVCSLSFSGSLHLIMSWIRYSTGSVVQNTANIIDQSMIITPVNFTDNGETFTFKAIFGKENNIRQTVVTWNYTVKVLYRPRNIVINPIRLIYQVGDLLVCSADENPTPSYIWTDITGSGRAIHGSNLMIENNMKSDQTYSFNCSAYNSVARTTWYIISETVTFRVKETQHISTQTMVLAIAVSLTVFCFIQLMIYGCFKVCNKIKLKRQETMAEAHESELNHDLEEETTLANEHSQHQESTYQNLEKERLFDVQPYSGLHIYANANASTDASANQGIL